MKRHRVRGVKAGKDICESFDARTYLGEALGVAEGAAAHELLLARRQLEVTVCGMCVCVHVSV